MDDDTPDHSEPGPAAVDAEYVAQLLAERDRLRAEVDRLNAVLDQADAVTRRIDAAVDRATENATRLIAERDKLRALLAEAAARVPAGKRAAVLRYLRRQGKSNRRP